MNRILGERKLVFKPSDGSPTQTVVARFGHPEPGSDGIWCVDVHVKETGKSGTTDRAHGMDQAQAMLHAFLLLDAQLDDMAARGSIELSESNEPVEQEPTEKPEAWRFVPRIASKFDSSIGNGPMLAKVDVLGERELALKGKDGNEENVIIRLGHPTMSSDHWRAPCEIIGPGDAIQHRSGPGEDPIQALTHLLYLIPVLLDSLAEGGEFSTREGAAGHGFPRILIEERPGTATK
ncbi:hypothetical protein WME75_03280 [Sorangium sp. So ce1014]|uniref:DUF6968 family protein n=1 Tax=Sorangium sp. So ce1014 TaxID=3133326 RepID=UPI003F60E877